MIKNILKSSGEVIALAVGQNYTLKNDEVSINKTIYKKCDLEIALTNTASSNDDDFIGVGIKKRDGVLNLPANFSKFNEWEIDGVSQVDLSICVTSITASIQCPVGTGTGQDGDDGQDADYTKVILVIDGIPVSKKNKVSPDINAIEVGDQIVMGEVPASSGRFITANVTALPYTNDANLKIISKDYIQQ